MCTAPGAPLELKTITLPPLKETQVQVDIEMCGLCHTDIHMQDNDWGISNYPMVPGHEGVGFVSVVGSAVHHLKVGDRVGIAWMRDSCNDCGNCKVGRENICLKGYQGTFLSSNAGCWGKENCSELGCFSKVVHVEEKFAFKIPDIMPSPMAASLLCGGGTVWEPVCDYVTPGSKVGVISIGGLGTTAIKLAHIVGGDVVAFSSSANKEAAVREIGATGFVVTSDKEAMAAATGTLDVIIDTCPANSDVASLMDLLKFNGTYVRVGIPPAADQSFSYKWIPLIFTQKKIAGSIVTGSERSNSLFSTAAAHWDLMKESDDWKVEVVPFEEINEAMHKLKSRTNKGYRYILKW